jgi:hypothetical protein
MHYIGTLVAAALVVAPASALVVSPTPRFASVAPPASSRAVAPVLSAATDDFVPDMQRRTIMNLVLLGGAGIPVLWMGGGFVYFFIPPSAGGGGGCVRLPALHPCRDTLCSLSRSLSPRTWLLLLMPPSPPFAVLLAQWPDR